MNLAKTMQELLQPLLAAQRYAVLATDNGGQPYTSLMAFAASEDLQALTLVTERATHKYANLTTNPRVAVFIDNRENVGADTREAVAVTAIGEAQEVTGDDCARLRAAYIVRHPYLMGFASSPSCAIVRVSVKSYVAVRRFEEVLEWRLDE
jgi:nitroimidazol reductase NimA-like FMN-containing flavoprotein (pyridoxamine 5'-phosphate oxidase superfamily)